MLDLSNLRWSEMVGVLDVPRLGARSPETAGRLRLLRTPVASNGHNRMSGSFDPPVQGDFGSE